MKKLLTQLNQSYHLFFLAMVFIAGIGLIFLVFPGESRFKYEFQKGKPWLHETLMAPFDFPIYKTDKQIQNEKDSILKFFNPYFVYDSSVFESELEKFRMFYHRKTNEYIESKFGKNDVGSRKQDFLSNAKNFESFSIKIMTDVYLKGIREVFKTSLFLC